MLIGFSALPASVNHNRAQANMFTVFQWTDSDGTFKIDNSFNPPKWTITSAAHGNESGTATIVNEGGYLSFNGSGTAGVNGYIFGTSSGLCNVQGNDGSNY